MGVETAETVTNVSKSDGMVKITIEHYQQLMEKAREKAPIVYNTIQKTPEVSASENKAWGVTFIGLGVAFLAVGAIRLRTGISQAAALK